MTIPLTGTGGLFTRIGYCLGMINAYNTFRGTTIPNAILDLKNQFNSTDQEVIDGIYNTLASGQSAMGGFPSAISTLASSILIQMADDDFLQPNNSLGNAMGYLITQMRANSDTVKACTVGSSATPGGSNTGNAILVISTKTRLGYTLENIFNETIGVSCTVDAQSGGATQGQESLQFSGQQGQGNVLSWLYPQGSGANAGLNLISANQAGGSGTNQNYLNNSNFETWTVANVPDDWHVGVGAAGTQVLQSTAVHYDGSSSLEFVGDASTLTSIVTQSGVDFSANLVSLPLTQFVINLYAKVDVAPAAGVLEVALVDGSGTIIQDSLGNNNAFTQSLASLGTSFVPLHAYFRTPRVMPGAVYVRIRLSTALSVGSNLFIDHAALGQAAPLYTSGPYVAGFSGSVNLIQGDSYSLGISNNYGGGFQVGFNKLFGMRTLNSGSLLPSATGGAETIPDSLITL